MGQLAERFEQHLGAAPGRCSGRDVDHELARDPAQAPVNMGFIGQFLFEQANPQARQGSFQCVELQREIHGPKVCLGVAPRNLVVLEARSEEHTSELQSH